jgi:hypothetical protein
MDKQLQQEVRKVVLDELKKGNTPEKIIEWAKAEGIDEQVIITELKGIAAAQSEEALVLLPMIQNFLGAARKQKQKTQPEESKHTFWDPTGETVTNERFKLQRKEIEEKYDAYLKNPGIPRRNLLIFSLPAIATVLLLIFRPQSLNLVSQIDDGQGLLFLLLPFVPAIIYISHVFKVQRRLIKLAIAADYHWVFCPEERPQKWQMLKDKYPELFQKGNKDQTILDEIWGDFESNGETTPFWAAIFQYVIETRDSKGRRNRKTITKTAYALQLNKTLKTDFRLEPEGLMGKFLNLFRRNKEINTESTEFNKNFMVYYNGKKVDKELEIIKLLTPSVQVRLNQLQQQKGKFALQFRGNTVIYLFPKRMIRKMKTNFFKGVRVHPEDKEKLEAQLHNFLSISSDIVRYLD